MRVMNWTMAAALLISTAATAATVTTGAVTHRRQHGVITMASPAPTSRCRDAHGKFIKCPPPSVKATTTTTTSTTSKHCRNAKGQFAKCGTPGAH